MTIVRHKGKKGPCSTQDCWQLEIHSGYCSACYQALHRLRQKSVAEIGYYLKRVQRFRSRALSLAHRVRRVS